MLSYEDAWAWVDAAPGNKSRTLLLGNGFSVAYDPQRFSYRALRDSADKAGFIGSIASRFFSALETYDFEQVIRQMLAAATALEVLDATQHQQEIEALRVEAAHLKEGLARTLADLHPERPGDIADEVYAQVRVFLERFGRVYSANYDLLLYWTLMHDDGIAGAKFKTNDDGFRDPDNHDAEYVVWNYLDPHTQTVYYLHGALHLYRDVEAAELQKLTWVRTGEPLIDQIRRQLAADRFPLIVAEGTIKEKLAKIQTSDYLSKGLRSLAGMGGGLVAFGLSMSENDEHILRAIAQSTASRLAVSVYGDPTAPGNHALMAAARKLTEIRARNRGRVPLQIEFFDAATTPLWDV